MLPSVSQEPLPGLWPPAALPHCGGPTHRDRALGQRKRPLPSGRIGASISRGVSAAGFLAWVIKMDRGRAPSECHGHCFWHVHIPCPLGPQWLVRNQTSRGRLDGRPRLSPGSWEAESHSHRRPEHDRGGRQKARCALSASIRAEEDPPGPSTVFQGRNLLPANATPLPKVPSGWRSDHQPASHRGLAFLTHVLVESLPRGEEGTEEAQRG